MENLIQVIAGHPGAGKTSWVSQEITALAKDKNNIIIFIGREEEYEQIVQVMSLMIVTGSVSDLNMPEWLSAVPLTWQTSWCMNPSRMKRLRASTR